MGIPRKVLDGISAAYRQLRPKTWTKSEDEFCNFVRENDAEYVTVFGATVLVASSSDHGKMLYEVRATTMTPFGRVFGLKKLVKKVHIGPWDSAEACKQAKRELQQAVADTGQLLPNLVPASARISVHA